MLDLEGLYQEYAKLIYRYIYLKCRNEDVAEEIVQITFLKAITKVDSFQGRSKVYTWLCQIAKNEYLNYCRKNNRKRYYEESVEDDWQEVSAKEPYYHDTILEKIILKEQVSLVLKILNSIGEPYRQVIILRIYGECSFEEIGASYEKNATWARVTYFRARKKILEKLKDEEGYDEV